MGNSAPNLFQKAPRRIFIIMLSTLIFNFFILVVLVVFFMVSGGVRNWESIQRQATLLLSHTLSRFNAERFQDLRYIATQDVCLQAVFNRSSAASERARDFFSLFQIRNRYYHVLMLVDDGGRVLTVSDQDGPQCRLLSDFAASPVYQRFISRIASNSEPAMSEILTDAGPEKYILLSHPLIADGRVLPGHHIVALMRSELFRSAIRFSEGFVMKNVVLADALGGVIVTAQGDFSYDIREIRGILRSSPDDKGLDKGFEQGYYRPSVQPGTLLITAKRLDSGYQLLVMQYLDKIWQLYLPSIVPVTLAIMAAIGAIGALAIYLIGRERRRWEKADALVADNAARLEAANRDLESFSYSVSHDLRAPLRAVTGFAAMLKEDHSTHLNEDGLRLLDTILDNARRMGVLIQDLLEFSRLGQRQLSIQDVRMASLAREVFEEIMTQNPDRTIDIVIGNVRNAKGDQSLIRQVFLNIIGNAVKFTRDNVTAKIEIGDFVEENTGITVYYIRDNGAGFNMQYADKLFRVFQRLHSDKDYEGTGVGLAIVERIISKHGGRVWAESSPGNGAVFYFTLDSVPVKQING